MTQDQLLTEMLRLSERLSELDFTLEEHLVELEEIQERQSKIQAEYDQLVKEGDLTPSIREVVAKIIASESENLNRMQKYKAELEKTTRDIQEAKRVKNLYENAYTQSFGYFVDSHK